MSAKFANMVFFPGKRLKCTREKFFNEFDLIRGKDFKNAEDMFNHICKNYNTISVAFDCHGGCSMSSMIFSSMITAILDDGKY